NPTAPPRIVGIPPTRNSVNITPIFLSFLPRNGEAIGNPSVMFWNRNPIRTTRAAPEAKPKVTPKAPKTRPSVRFWNPIPSAIIRAVNVGVRPLLERASKKYNTRNPPAKDAAKRRSLSSDVPYPYREPLLKTGATFEKMSPNKKTSIPIATAFKSIVYRTSILLRSTMGSEMKIDSPIIAEKNNISGKLAIDGSHPKQHDIRHI